MIRTTISRIRRVCTIAFLPRLLRSELRYSPSIIATFGKFEKFTTVHKTAQRRSKSSDRDPEPPGDQDKYGSICGQSEKKETDVRENIYLSLDINERKKIPDKVSDSTSRCQCEQCTECNRILAEIFGEDTNSTPDDILPNEVEATNDILEKIAQVNMADDTDHDQMITDSRIRVGLFDSPEMEKEEEDCELKPEKRKTDEDKDNSLTDERFRSVLCHEVILTNDKSKGVETTRPEHVNPHGMYTNLYNNIDSDSKSNIPLTKYGKQEVDDYWSEVYETAIGENCVYVEPNINIDAQTLYICKLLQQKDSQYEDTKEGSSKRVKHSKEDLDKMLYGSESEAATIYATTVKQDREKLDQRVENIDETPLVEAEKHKIEESNTGPKILSNVERTNIIEKSLDKVAERCLRSSSSKIDEILLREMEKLSIPLTGQKAERHERDDVVNSLKESNRDNENVLKNQELKEETDINKSLSSTRQEMVETAKQFLFDLDRTRLSDEKAHGFPSDRSNVSESRTRRGSMDMSDDSDKELKRMDDVREDNIKQSSRENTSSILKPDQLPGPRRGTPELSDCGNKSSFSEDVWKKELDPNHVLTCNETCSISPKPIVRTDDLSSLKDTEIVFERNVIPDEEARQTHEVAKKIPLLEDGEEYHPKFTKTVPEKDSAYNLINEQALRLDSSDANMIPTEKNYTSDDVEKLTSSLKATSSAMITGGSTKNALKHNSELRTNIRVIDDSPSKQHILPLETKSIDLSVKPEDEVEDPNADKSGSSVTQMIIEIPQKDLEETENKPSSYDGDKLTDDIYKSILATSEQLQATSEKMQATSNQLQATSEQLHATNQQLLSTTDQLFATTELLESTAANLAQESAKYQFSLANEIIEEAQKGVTISTSSAENREDSTKVNKDVNKLPSQQAEKNDPKYSEEDDPKESPSKDRTTNLSGLAHQSAAINPAEITPSEGVNPALEPLPNVNKVKLSELMEIVRERNRLLNCTEYLESAVDSKRKSCPPLSQPMHNTPAWKLPNYPEIKPRPKICTPKRKPTNPSKVDCSLCDLGSFGFSHTKPQEEMVKFGLEDSIYQLESQSVTLAEESPVANLTDDIIYQLQSLGSLLKSVYQQGKMETLEAAVVAKTRQRSRLFRSRDYDPWCPIPSWHHVKKEEKTKFHCPKDGCKMLPPGYTKDSWPCGLKSCDTFPTHPRRNCSVPDYFAVSLGNHKVVDLGEF